LPRPAVGRAGAPGGGGCTSSPPCRAFTSLQHRAAGAAYAADTGRHGQAASERHQPGCNCMWVCMGPGAAPPPLVADRPLARPLPMAGVGFPLPSLFLPVKHREEEGELIPVLCWMTGGTRWSQWTHTSVSLGTLLCAGVRVDLAFGIGLSNWLNCFTVLMVFL